MATSTKVQLKNELSTYCELHWWNFGKKTLSFKGELGELLKKQSISFSVKKTKKEGIFTFNFKGDCGGVSYKQDGLLSDFSHFAKQTIQMELVRMGYKSKLYVSGSWCRPTVTINF